MHDLLEFAMECPLGWVNYFILQVRGNFSMFLWSKASYLKAKIKLPEHVVHLSQVLNSFQDVTIAKAYTFSFLEIFYDHLTEK